MKKLIEGLSGFESRCFGNQFVVSVVEMLVETSAVHPRAGQVEFMMTVHATRIEYDRFVVVGLPHVAVPQIAVK